MNYELAKQLKDAGFPDKECYDEICHHDINPDAIAYHPPNLEELVEALPRTVQFSFIRNVDRYHITTMEGGSFDGTTPTEAVAMLWFALNK